MMEAKGKVLSGAVFPGDRNTISAGRKPGHMDKDGHMWSTPVGIPA